MLRVACHQPGFLPWLGFMNKLAQVDTMVLMAGVAISDDAYVNRVRSPAGGWLTVPVAHGEPGTLIRDVRIAQGRGFEKLIRTIEQGYCSSRWPHGARVVRVVEVMRRFKPGDRVLDLNVACLEEMRALFGLNAVSIVVDDKVRTDGSTMERLIDLIRAHSDGKEVTYFMGAGGRGYCVPKLVPPGMSFMVQEVRRHVSPGSALQVLAEMRSPCVPLNEAATWASYR